VGAGAHDEAEGGKTPTRELPGAELPSASSPPNAKTAVLDEAPSRAPAAAEPAAPEATPAIADAPAVAAHASADVLDIGAPRAQLREVGFRQLPGASRVYVRTSVTPRFTIQDVGENVIRVELENTRATRRNDLRHLDTSFFPSAVAVVTPARRGASYVLDIKLRERVPYQQRIEGQHARHRLRAARRPRGAARRGARGDDARRRRSRAGPGRARGRGAGARRPRIDATARARRVESPPAVPRATLLAVLALSARLAVAQAQPPGATRPRRLPRRSGARPPGRCRR
jgi:hypothetical protein